MAEFKLGRIRFVWKGDWTQGTTYVRDDVVKYGGKTYICQIGHTSDANFYTDLDFVPTKWNQMTDGQEWKDDWNTSTFYSLNDVVKYGGLLYICAEPHTSANNTTLGLEQDQNKWELFAEGFDWKEDWTTSTRYKVNDLVKYGGYTYVCNEAHTSAATTISGLEADQSKWDEFNRGIEYLGTWDGNSVRYKINDVVKYGAGLWICVTAHTSTSDFIIDQSNWSQFVKGFEFEDDWNSSTIYQPGDIVKYGGNQYISLTNHSDANPRTDTTNWSLFLKGFDFSSDWNISTSYRIGEVVRVNGYVYLATTDVPSITFDVIESKSSNNTFVADTVVPLIIGSAIRFTGTTFGDVNNGGTYYIQSLNNFEFTISDTPGGATFVPDDDVGTMTATSAPHPTNTLYYQTLNTGVFWRDQWQDDREYDIGDIVRFGANAYICIQKHRSEEDDGSTVRSQGGGAANSRPDQDTIGVYWSALSIGSETSVLQVKGDLVYYDTAGPARLPVGLEGQVLRVSNDNLPEWITLGGVDHTYYVATTGKDEPAPINGLTWDKPFRTIRYACEQVENGPRNPNAKYLLELNRIFIQREVTEWIQRQIATNTAPFTSSFVYDDFKCERDTGLIIDAVIFDISHGGNVKTRGAANALVNVLLDSPGTYLKLQSEKDQDIAAWNYMLDLVEDVLAQRSPSVNYQILNGDNSTAVVAQYFNNELAAEPVVPLIRSLVGIILQAVEDGDDSNIPERVSPTNLVNVATGTYREVLPIIVPEQTCVKGAELRSTNAGPREGTTPKEDVFYSVSALHKMSEIVSDIVVGNSVDTIFSGSTQSIEFPFADIEESETAAQLARVIKYNIDFRCGTITTFGYPDPKDYNTAYLQGYKNARTLVENNKEFLKEEVRAWLNANFPNLKFSRTKCLRDVGYVVDAMIYDLTYGGNNQSVQAGLSYYEGIGSNLVIDSTEKQATLAAYAFLKSRTLAVASNTSFLPLNTQIPRTAGTAGSAASLTLIGDNFDDIIEIINNGPLGNYTLVNPGTSWVSGTLTSAASTLASAIPSIQDATIDYINSNFGNFTYDSAKCRRDLGIILEGVYFDVAFGTNFNAVTNGSSYRRAMAIEVIQGQLEQTVGAIQHAKGLAAEALSADSTAVSRSNDAFDEIIDIIVNGVGSADPLVYTDPGVDNNKLYARQQLVANRDFIRAEIIAWINVNFPSLSYNQATCSRDIGLIVDALAYDIQYGGNTATRTAAQAYFEGAVSVLPAGQKAPTAAALDRLKGIVGDIVIELPVSVSAGNTEIQDTSGTVSSSTEVDELTGLVQIIEDVVAADSLTGLPAKVNPSISWAAAGIQSAVTNLANETVDIVKATLQYISDEYNSFTYNHSKCSRDVGIILDAVRFDFMFNANWQTLKSAYSYLRGTASEVFSLGQKTVTREALKFVKSLAVQNVNGDTTTISRINSLMQSIDDIIYSGSNEGSPCATEQRNRDYAVLQLERNREFIVSEITDWMEYNYVNFDTYYNSSTCARDVGLILDAVSYDLITGSNFPSSVAGASYYRIQSALVTGKQLLQTLEAFRFVKETAASSVDPTLYTTVNSAFDNILTILENGLSAIPTYVFPANGTTDADGNTTGNTFQSNRSTYQTAIANYLDTNFNSLWVSLGTQGQESCTRDVGYIVDAVTFDIKYGGNYQSVIAGDAYYSFGTLQIAPGEVAATLAAYGELKTLLQTDAEASKTTAVGNLLDDIIDIITNGAGTVSTTYPVETGESVTVQGTFTAIQAAKSTIQTATTQFITDTFSSYTYNSALCERDTNKFIDALKYDLKYPGNYRSLFAARYYANAVIGSFEEDMYYLRDATGIRDMTLEGLSGDLTPANIFGTSRVTSGAYCSLDPGWGPDDFRAWIIDRSPYVQGVTTFGTACIGQKIDGALHNGGNDSIVSNDFTQVLSDGIGAWVENNGRAELVSVFTYYNHIGYLSTNGGRIRGTNGNNSYGTFGSVAEGFDPTEVPNTAVVDNRFQFEANVRNVFTNGNQMQLFEFENAGIDYTKLTWTLTGGGLNAAAIADEFRDDAVYQVRLLDLGDDSSGQFGGEGYLTNSNTAQGGTSSSITLAATDDELSTAYIGMKILLTAGAGVGQFGIVTGYNSGTKIANVIRESDGSPGWDHVVPGTAIVSPDASTVYSAEPRLIFDGPGFSSQSVSSLPSGAYNDVVFGELTDDYFSVTGSYSGLNAQGATFDVTKKGWKYNVFINSGGTGYTRLETITIPGTSLGGLTPDNDLTIIITAVDSVTREILNIDFDGNGDGGRYVALKGTSTDQGAYSNNGLSWTAMTLPSSGNWTSIAHGILNDGSSFDIVGRFVAVRSGSNQAAWSDDGINWNAATMPVSTDWQSVTFGNGIFVAISNTTTDVAVSLDGLSWDAAGPLNSTGFVEVTAGRGIFVAIKFNSDTVSTSPDAVTWTDRTLPASSNWNSVVWGNNRFIAVSTNSNNGAYSLNGINWSAMTIGSADGSTVAGYQKVRYGQGLFMTTAYRSGDQDYSFVAASEYGITWNVEGVTAPPNSISGYSALAFGSPQRKGYWVALNLDAGTIGARIRTGATTKGRAFVAQEKIFAVSITEPGSGYNTIPTMTIVDPNNLFEVPHQVRLGSGCVATPTFTNRGNQYATGSAEVDIGDGYADNYQPGGFVAVRRITQRPIPGSDIVFSNLPGRNFKLVNVITFLGTNDGAYTAFFQISPTLSIGEAPDHLDDVSTRIRYSQVRLTGHDFLDIGTGGFVTSNYPNAPLVPADPSKETRSQDAGRVFFTSTDQDGNFRVGDLFAIEQSTGIATLNADAFNISGLQELNLGNVTLGGGSATITEFSTDPFFTADSDNVVPTQRAIKAFISSQIGGGGASLNVNSVTAGSIVISSNVITTTTNVAIKMTANFEFRRGVTGAPLAFNYFFK